MNANVIAGSSLIFSRRSLEQALDGLVQLGFRHVDLAMHEGWAHVSPSETLADEGAVVARLTEVLARRGLRAVACNVGLGDRDEDQRLAAVARTAARLGCPVLTVNAGPAGSDVDADLRRFRRWTAVAGDIGVQLTVETHRFHLTENPDVALRYAREVPGLGLTLDPSHFAVGPFWPCDLKPLFPHVRHVHLRPAGRKWEDVQLPADAGVLDLPGLRRQLIGEGYVGAFTVEYVDALPGVDHPTEAERLRMGLEG